MLPYEIENVAFCDVYKSREQCMVDSTMLARRGKPQTPCLVFQLKWQARRV